MTTSQGAVSQELEWQTCCMRNKSHERLWPPLLKLKFGNSWLTSQCCGSSCKNSIPVFNSNSNSRGFNSNSIFNSTNFNSNSGIGIGIELQFQFRNWIDPNPDNGISPRNNELKISLVQCQFYQSSIVYWGLALALGLPNYHIQVSIISIWEIRICICQRLTHWPQVADVTISLKV